MNDDEDILDKEDQESELDGMSDAAVMERVRAVRAFVDNSHATEDASMYAFLSIFHPEMDEQTKRELARDVQRK